MRWQSAQCGQERIRSGYLWLPKMAPRQHWRWLERATWREKYASSGCGWQLVDWVDEPKSAPAPDAMLHNERVNTGNLRKLLTETFDENGNVSMSKAEAFLFGQRIVLPILLNEVDALRIICDDSPRYTITDAGRAHLEGKK